MSKDFLHADKIAEAGVPGGDRIIEAARLFRAGMTGAPSAQARLSEAMTTSDFPTLLGQALEIDMLHTYRDYVPQWQGIADTTEVADFRPKTLKDLFGPVDYELVAQGEEYKATSLSDTKHEIKVAKYGITLPFTWEMQLNQEWEQLARIPDRLAKGARKREDRAVIEAFVSNAGPRATFFKGKAAVAAKPLTIANLWEAYKSITQRLNNDGDPVDTGSLVLVVPKTLEADAQRILNTERIKTTVGDTTTEESNYLRGVFTLKVLDGLTAVDKSTKAATTWYVLPGVGTTNPALVKASLRGYAEPDIRVKNDAGRNVAGGDIDPTAGSFDRDVITYRGRHVTGATAVYNTAVYASTGA